MAEIEHPQIYLITPPEFELSIYPNILSGILDVHGIACVRLTMSTKDEDRIQRAADVLRDVCHARDVPLVIESYVQLVERLGLDGVHLTDGARSVRTARKSLGADTIVGAFCGASRHDGMSAAEASADYAAFGPVTPGALGDGSIAKTDLFAWWSEMIEVPIVAEGSLDDAALAELAPHTDFFGIGPEIWGSDNPVARLGQLITAMK